MRDENRMPRHYYATLQHHVLFLCLCALVLTAGCGRQEQLVFESSEVVEKLPALHQKQVNEQIERLFGSPTTPFIRVPDETAEESDEIKLVDVVTTQSLLAGAAVYYRRCSMCHGVSGNGQGEAAAYLQPRPRDYRPGKFKFKATQRSEKPFRSDLARLIRNGAKGTSMPSFKWLPHEDIEAVVDYVIYLSKRGEVQNYVSEIAGFDYAEDEDLDFELFQEGLDIVLASWGDDRKTVVNPLTPRPAYNDASIQLGREAFLQRGCATCHGKDGRGQTEWLSPEYIARQEQIPEAERVKVNYDEWGNVAPAADLTAGMLHGGRRPIDVYRRIFAGINGTPMPAFETAFAQEPETIWHLSHYILSLVEQRETETDEQRP